MTDYDSVVLGAGNGGLTAALGLALRGVGCIVAEKRGINSGASGAIHGLPHSGGRYVSGDMTRAAEYRREAGLLKQRFVLPRMRENLTYMIPHRLRGTPIEP
jgi:glycerol-3-phosphate dehydrogenase